MSKNFYEMIDKIAKLEAEYEREIESMMRGGKA